MTLLPHLVNGLALGGGLELARHLAVVGAGGVEQQQAVSGGRGVEHHHGIARHGHGMGEGVKYRDFLGAWRTQVLQQQRAGWFVQCLAARGHYFVNVFLGLGARVDALHAEVRHLARQRIGEMGGGIGGAEMHRDTARREADRDGRGYGGLADTALAHDHDEPAPGGGQFIREL